MQANLGSVNETRQKLIGPDPFPIGVLRSHPSLANRPSCKRCVRNVSENQYRLDSRRPFLPKQTDFKPIR